MSYLKYMDMIAEVDGHPVDKEARAKLYAERGITTKDFNWDDKEVFEGYGTVWFKNNLPFYAATYTWSQKKQGGLEEKLEEGLGCKIKCVDWSGGNGHETFGIEVDVVRTFQARLDNEIKELCAVADYGGFPSPEISGRIRGLCQVKDMLQKVIDEYKGA